MQPEVPLKGSLNVRLNENLHRRIAKLAAQQHISINKLIVNTLDKAISTHSSAA